jgi:hypothetical protein
LLACAAATVAACLALSPPALAGDPLTSIKINEVESDGAADFIELINISATSTDVSGLVLKDNDDSRTLAIPSGTAIAAGGFLAVDTDVPGGFGLGASDSARVFMPDGITLIDGYTWTAHAASTFGRCPDGSGSFVTTGSVTKGAANDCPPAPSPPAPSATDVAVTPTSVTATVAAVSGPAGTPTGTVAFTVDGSPVGSATLMAGLAALAYDVPSGGDRTVVATYSGDGSFNGSSDTLVRRDPAITASVSSSREPSAAGWYRGPVTVSFTCTPKDAPVTCPATVVLAASGADQTVSGTAEAADGGGATATASGIDIDRVKPRVKVGGVKAARLYKRKAPKARCRATDTLSRVASCKLKTRKKGSKRIVTATATDRAGNVAKTKLTYRVQRRV